MRRAVAFCCGLAVLVAGLAPSDDAAAKRKAPYRPQPDLRIVSVTPDPLGYRTGEGAVDIAVAVELPKDLDPRTLLDISLLIASPSKTSIRFLSHRQPVEALSLPAADLPDAKSRTTVVLTWDGTDLHRRAVTPGAYDVRIQAKLLAIGENGPHTHMVSWPKLTVMDVK